MKALNIFLSILLLFTALSHTHAQEPRHKAKGGDHIIELVPGLIPHNGKTEFSLGLDYEFFPQEDHHYSIGFSYEAEYMELTEHFFGPHVAWYFLGHQKLFFATGIGWDEEHTYWKQNIGYGYEMIFKNHFVLVPAVIIEHSPMETHSVISLGLGFEF